MLAAWVHSKKIFWRIAFQFVVILFLPACNSKPESQEGLFECVDNAVSFENRLHFTERLNPYTYRNFYNGAGVALGDVNNDGLLDIFFAGNQVDCKLYLNLGSFKFKDISQQAGVSCHGAWSTGVTFVDINADGFLDIYVCQSGDPDVPSRNNKLFVNMGDLTFLEQSKQYGLDFIGLGVQSAFFDYDKDGDLDCYLLTNSFKPVGNFDFVKGLRDIPDPQGGNKFLRNENGKFIDDSEQVGIYSSSIGFGLGITLGDFNCDEWTDIYVSNDFFERDYLYINDTKGGFTEELPRYFQSISMGSMGADFADLDNDGFSELFVTEMLPDSLHRRKSKTVYEPWNKYVIAVGNGYHHQFSRNVLQKRIDSEHYLEIGRFSGVSASEWSWGALLFDMNNDGHKDIFIANGISKDLLDRDYLTYTASEENIRRIIQQEKDPIVKLIDLMPSSSFSNYAFKNEGNFKFINSSKLWGLDKPMYSSGSAYGDLDNDGDLDIVLNNVNSSAVIYRNTTDTSLFKSLTVKTLTNGKNRYAIGARVAAYNDTKAFVADNFVNRGFQSSVQPHITLGLGQNIYVLDSVKVWWPEGGTTIVRNVRANGTLLLKKEDALAPSPSSTCAPSKNIRSKLSVVDEKLFNHQSSGLVDFDRERLLPHMYSNESGSMTVGDIDGDGVEEVYVAGGKDQQSKFLRYGKGKFVSVTPLQIAKYSLAEETKSLLLDIDNDGDLDLYMACGGRFFSAASSALTDRLFINDGAGEFVESVHPLPFTEFISTSVVKGLDFDSDGDSDLLIGERFDPFVYGKGGRLFLFENTGGGRFLDKSYLLKGLHKVGMVTDVEVVDINADQLADIVVVGDWMPVLFSINKKGVFSEPEEMFNHSRGWWNTIETADFNSDHIPDFVLGNHGLNSFFKSGDRMYVSDFDRNGSIEQVFCTRWNDAYYPVLDKDELVSQLPYLRRSLLYYNDYSKKHIEEIFNHDELASAKIFEVDQLASMLILSEKDGFKAIPLNNELQFSPIYSFLAKDLDEDGIVDLVAGGNHFQVKPQFGRYDASLGWFLRGTFGPTGFSFTKVQSLGINGQIRDIKYVEFNEEGYVFFSKHGDALQVLKLVKP